MYTCMKHSFTSLVETHVWCDPNAVQPAMENLYTWLWVFQINLIWTQRPVNCTSPPSTYYLHSPVRYWPFPVNNIPVYINIITEEKNCSVAIFQEFFERKIMMKNVVNEVPRCNNMVNRTMATRGPGERNAHLLHANFAV